MSGRYLATNFIVKSSRCQFFFKMSFILLCMCANGNFIVYNRGNLFDLANIQVLEGTAVFKINPIIAFTSCYFFFLQYSFLFKWFFFWMKSDAFNEQKALKVFCIVVRLMQNWQMKTVKEIITFACKFRAFSDHRKYSAIDKRDKTWENKDEKHH